MENPIEYDYDYIIEELIEGQIFNMSPRPTINHCQVSENISHIMANYLHGKTCRSFGDGIDLFLTPKNRFVPDGMVVCDPDKIKNDGVHGAPDLVVEVLSPSTAKNDRSRKKAVYEKCGVKEYWLVSPSVWMLEQYLLQDGRLELHEIYRLYDPLLEKLTEEEQAELVTSFKCSLFDDLDIRLEDVFYRVNH